MSHYLQHLTFVAEGPNYLLMADAKGQLIRVTGLTDREIAQLEGHAAQNRPSSYQLLMERIAELSS
jgi:hypothetical protein